MDKQILETLEKIGLTPGEARTYLALVTLGSSTVGPIIEKADISASKVYYILERLQQKGLVSILVKNKTKTFTATNPEKIVEYLDKEKEKINEHKKRAQDILPSLKLKRETAAKLPLVEFTKGQKGFESFYEETFRKAKRGDVYAGIGGRRVSFKQQSRWFKQSVMLSRKGISQHLTYEHYSWHKKDPKIHQRKKRKLYYPKVLEKKYKELPNILTLGDHTLITELDENNEIFTLMIRNKNLTDAIKKLIKIVRDVAKVPCGFKEEEN